MTLTELHYLRALAEEEHFGRAARRCCVSQSTLSMAIKRLEQALGSPLFERSRQGVRPTATGARVLECARRALRHCDAIRELAIHADDPLQGPLTLGAATDLAPYWLPPLLAYWDAPLITRECPAETLAHRLVAGELDAALTGHSLPNPELVTRSLCEDPLVVVLPRQHRLSTRTALTADDLIGQTLLLPDQDTLQALQHACPLLEATAHTVISPDTRKQMVAHGLGLALLPRSSAGPLQLPHTLTARPLFSPVAPRHIKLCWRASFARPAAIEQLIAALHACQDARLPAPDAQEDTVFMANRHW